jgi:hypothetical protein
MAKKSKNQNIKKEKRSGVNNKINTGTSANKQKPEEDMVLSNNTDDQFERIYGILNLEIKENDEDHEDDKAVVNEENLEKFLTYLKNKITLPVIVTGIEDMGCFGWEEFYNFGPGSKTEYENLKKKYPSFRDKYELIGFIEEFDVDEGLSVDVLRVSDKKKFALPLADLKTVEKKSKNAILLDDYAVWYTNFR